MKKILLILTAALILVCSFALLASAEDKIVPSTSNEFGELTVFDEAIGNTKISQLKDDGTVARVVLFDGTNYYTVPTYYVLTESTKSTGEMMLMNFNEINSKLSKSFNKNSIIRFEMPSDIDFIANNMETFNGCQNMIEVKLNQGLRFWDNGTPKAFANCKKLVEIDISMVDLCYANNTYSLFEYCENLTKVTLPDAYLNNGTPINYSTNYMFNGCTKLTTIENTDNFFVGTTAVAEKMFRGCKALTEFPLWDGITTFGSYACSECTSIEKVVFPQTVTTIGTNATVFASCTSLKKIVLPNGPVSLGSYCFEKCTALTDVWMPAGASTFSAQVFGQCGNNLNVNFYFTTAQSTITISNATNNKDPFITALNTVGDERIKFNTPLSTKCTVFLGGHDISGEGVYEFSGESYVTDYLKATSCSRGCGEKITDTVCGPLFTNKGYSKETDGSLFTFGIVFNKEEIAKFLAVQAEGYVFNYGIVLANAELSAEGKLFDESAQVISGAYSIDVTNVNYTIYDLKITGIKDTQKDIPIYASAYVIDNGTASYIGETVTDSAVAVTYNTIKKED